MARWRQQFIVEVAKHLQQLGLTCCPVCQSDNLEVLRYPLLSFVGGLPPTVGGKDFESNIDFFVRVECHICGHILLFNSARFRKSNEEILVSGLTEAEENEVERENPL